MKVNFENVWQKIRELFARKGYTCDCCGVEVFDYPTHRICNECSELLIADNFARCLKCGRKTVTEGVCLACKKELPTFDVGISALSYDGMSAAMINRFKNGERYLVEFFCERMAERMKESGLLSSDLLIVCVPMTKEKKLTRGYNQAEELAKNLSLKLGLEFDSEVLEKRKETSEQKHLLRKERQENVKTAFFVHKRAFVRDKDILLIDDIMTTGATGSACARVLKNAGANKVIFLTAVSLDERK